VKQRIKEETMTTDVIERMKLIDVAEQVSLRPANGGSVLKGG
jgi:hypothetical protein